MSLLKAWAPISGSNDPNVDVRIYPTGDNEHWCILFEAIRSNRSKGAICHDCRDNWSSVDQFRSQGLPVGEIGFVAEDRATEGPG